MKTIFDIDFNSEEIEFDYQSKLTRRLDIHSGDFDQSIINEIVLWKINRYAELNEPALDLLNQINKRSKKINIELTKKVLEALLNTKGIKLPIASTILRFKNPKLYQIIDQRAYRFIYKKELKIPNKTAGQIDLYLDYLSKLREVCTDYNIPFHHSDRILYSLDKKHNKNDKLKGYM